jgi:hypothetical protein
LPAIARISGQVVDANGEPAVDVLVWLWEQVWDEGPRLQNSILSDDVVTDSEGRYTVTAPPGEYFLRAQRTRPEFEPPRYYPEAADVNAAIPLSVRDGIDLSGIPVTLASGVADRPVQFEFPLPEYLPGLTEPLSEFISAEVSPLFADIRVLPGRLGLEDAYRVALRAVGESLWRTPPLAPGEYELKLELSDRLKGAVADDFEMNWGPVDPITRITFTVPGDTEPGSVIDIGRLQEIPKRSIEGRVLPRSTRGQSISFEDLPILSFWDRSLFGDARRATVRADGTFTLEFVPPGRFGLAPPPFQMELPGEWYLASATSGGRDIMKDGLIAGGGQTGPIELVLADGAASIGGIARDSGGALVPGARVILIPPPDRRGPLARFPTVTASSSGVYLIERIAPGPYRLLSIDVAGVPYGHPFWEDPAFLRQYELRGERITVDPGARLTINSEAILVVD